MLENFNALVWNIAEIFCGLWLMIILGALFIMLAVEVWGAYFKGR
jgi:hypothetical protein